NAEPHEPIPAITAADRAAAFQGLDAHVMHGESINSYWSLDRLEAWDADEDGTGMAWEANYAALGVIGLAPYKFEVEATAYVGESGQVGLGAEAEYEMLFTNRLIGQWLIEGEAWSKDDPAVGIGSGLSKVEAGFRLRYEFHRQFAPYVGVVWERAYGGTADQRRARSGDVDDTRVVAGVQIWF
ncbi:copper resistance protein B, partial [Luteimonas huabeiensis]|uniref:copper resistance protein B n=1 Tax=Luteimonas huabeiensis TaxID=1244513 RepID=UPI0004644CCB